MTHPHRFVPYACRARLLKPWTAALAMGLLPLAASAGIVTFNFSATAMSSGDAPGTDELATVYRAFHGLNPRLTGSFSYDTAAAARQSATGSSYASAEYAGISFRLDGLNAAGQSFSSVVAGPTMAVNDVVHPDPLNGPSSLADDLRVYGRPDSGAAVSAGVAIGFTYLSLADYVIYGPTAATGLTGTALPGSLNFAQFAEAAFLNFDLTDGSNTRSLMYRLDALSFQDLSTPPPTVAGIVQDFVATGTLPSQSIPGVFELPDALVSAITSLQDLLNLLFPASPPPADVSLGSGNLFDEVTVAAGVPVVFDPPVSVGYLYEIPKNAFATQYVDDADDQNTLPMGAAADPEL